MKYSVEKYSGKAYCGNGFFDTLDECYAFANDGFCDKMNVYDTETGKLIIMAKLF